jgi:hypothetical protein
MPADQVITTIPGYTLLRFWFFETSKANINAATDQTVKRPIIAWRVQADGRALPIAVASPPDVENFVGEECIVGPFSIYSLDDIRSWGDSASWQKDVVKSWAAWLANTAPATAPAAPKQSRVGSVVLGSDRIAGFAAG